MAQPAPPTLARVKSITHWNRFFHPEEGIFRTSNGTSIEHLDIDVRFVDPPAATNSNQPRLPVQLPNVVILTLRAGQDEDNVQRLKCLAEVLVDVNPYEVRWLGNSEGLIPPQSHFVHPLIVELGQKWSQRNCLQRLVIQGGFPCTNETQSYFDKNLVYAFGTWSPARIEWNLSDYTTNGALAIIKNYLQSTSHPDVASSLTTRPGAMSFSPKSSDVLLRLRDMIEESPIRYEIIEWLQDTTFYVQNDCASRVWYEEPECQTRLLARLRAELLIATHYPIIPPPHMPDPDLETVRTP